MKDCNAYASAPITRQVRGTLTQASPLILNAPLPARDGLWPELDSVSWSVSWEAPSGDPPGYWEAPPNALFFFYALERDEYTASTSPIANNPDASLAIVDPEIGLDIGGRGVGAARRWERYRVDVPAKLDNGNEPCQLAAALILTSAGSYVGSPIPRANGIIRVVYRWRRVCGRVCP